MWPQAAVAVLLLGAAEAQAGPASDAVRLFYEKPGLELTPEARNLFIDPARRVLLMDEEIRKGGEEGCLDPALPFDDADYDLARVLSTLKLSEALDGDRAVVTAGFETDEGTARVEWRLRKIGAVWKVSDLISQTKDWALSQFNCE
jgi:hypothetical protein